MGVLQNRVDSFWLDQKKTNNATQEEFAKKSGLSQPRVHQILGGSGKPITLLGLNTICSTFDIDLTTLIPELEPELKQLTTLLQENRLTEAVAKMLQLTEIHSDERFN